MKNAVLSIRTGALCASVHMCVLLVAAPAAAQQEPSEFVRAVGGPATTMWSSNAEAPVRTKVAADLRTMQPSQSPELRPPLSDPDRGMESQQPRGSDQGETGAKPNEVAKPSRLPFPILRKEHPVVYWTTAPAWAPVVFPFRGACWVGKKSEKSGFTSFLNFCGGWGSAFTPFVVGAK